MVRPIVKEALTPLQADMGRIIARQGLGGSLLGSAVGAGTGALASEEGERLRGAGRGAIVGGTTGLAGGALMGGGMAKHFRRRANELADLAEDVGATKGIDIAKRYRLEGDVPDADVDYLNKRIDILHRDPVRSAALDDVISKAEVPSNFETAMFGLGLTGGAGGALLGAPIAVRRAAEDSRVKKEASAYQAEGFAEELLKIHLQKEAGLRDLAAKAKGAVKGKIQDLGYMHDPAQLKRIEDLEQMSREIAAREGIDLQEGSMREVLGGIGDVVRGRGMGRLEKQMGIIGPALGSGGATGDAMTSSVKMMPGSIDLSSMGLLGANKRGARAITRQHEIDEVLEGRKSLQDAVGAQIATGNPSAPVIVNQYEPRKKAANIPERVVNFVENLQRKGAGLPSDPTVRVGRHHSPEVILNESGYIGGMPKKVQERFRTLREGDQETLGQYGFEYGKEVPQDVRDVVRGAHHRAGEKSREQIYSQLAAQ